MAEGRCAGCGYENKSCKMVTRHTASCPDFAKLYKDPATRHLAVEPATEYQRHHAEENLGKDDRREERISRNRAEANRKLGKQSERWQARTAHKF